MVRDLLRLSRYSSSLDKSYDGASCCLCLKMHTRAGTRVRIRSSPPGEDAAQIDGMLTETSTTANEQFPLNHIASFSTSHPNI